MYIINVKKQIDLYLCIELQNHYSVNSLYWYFAFEIQDRHIVIFPESTNFVSVLRTPYTYKCSSIIVSCWYTHEFEHGKPAWNEQFITKCSSSSRIYITYIKFKTNLSIEPYLNLVTFPKHRRAISQLRVSSHRLAIETGRHHRPPIPATERLRKYCDPGNIDDELHFITGCDFDTAERHHSYDAVHYYMPNFTAKDNRDKFMDILTSPDWYVLRNLGKYFFNGFKRRNAHHLYISWIYIRLI